MSVSAENYIEQIAVLILQGNESLSGYTVVRVNEETNPGVNRIVVKAMPRQVELFGKDQRTPKAWRIPTEITVHREQGAGVSDFDTAIAGIQSAFASGATVPTEASDLAAGQFPAGLHVEDTDDGEADHSENVRTRSKVFNWIAVA